MDGYDLGMVCLNGHRITGMAQSNPEFASAFCPGCGEPTTTKCGFCNASIRGHYHVPAFFSVAEWDLPAHCYACGKPYPWTQRRAETLSEMLDELEGLPEEERDRLKKSIADIIADTPKSETAVLRFKKAVAKVGEVGGKVLMGVLTNVATEGVKRSLGL